MLSGFELYPRWVPLIIASSDLSWSEHVRNVTVNKANKLLSLVHRTVGLSNPGAFFTL